MKKILIHLALAILSMMGLYIVIVVIMLWSIDNIENQTGKPIIESIGEEIGTLKESFDKGYNQDSISIK